MINSLNSTKTVDISELENLPTCELESRQNRAVRELLLSNCGKKILHPTEHAFLEEKLLVIDNIITSRRGY